MGILQGISTRAEAKRLQPFMRADEHFLECDVVEIPIIAWREGNRSNYGRAIIGLTSHAVYIRQAKTVSDAMRIPYATLVDLQGGPGMVEIVTQKANYLIKDIGRPMIPDLYDSLSGHMRRLERHSEVVEVPGGKVFAVFRPMDEDDPGSWVLRYSEDIDVKSPEVKAALERALAPAIARLGPLGF